MIINAVLVPNVALWTRMNVQRDPDLVTAR
jgi:hypothetical protein